MRTAFPVAAPVGARRRHGAGFHHPPCGPRVKLGMFPLRPYAPTLRPYATGLVSVGSPKQANSVITGPPLGADRVHTGVARISPLPGPFPEPGRAHTERGRHTEFYPGSSNPPEVSGGATCLIHGEING
jgi:hypothetical protein